MAKASAMKRVEKGHASKQRMVQAAGAAFREHGLGGIGVDGLAKAAELTSGAFYFHFQSKLDAFIQSLEANLDGLKDGIQQFQGEAGDAWTAAFADFYLGFKRTCDLRDGCALPLLSSEAERAGEPARTAYVAKLNEIFDVAALGLKDTSQTSSREQAYVFLALLVGGATLSRTVNDPELSEEIASAVKKAASTFAGKVDPSAG